MSNEKPEALELADIFENLAHPTGTRHRAATELRRQHARIQELEAMLEAVGAGGVSAQRITQGKDHIEQDPKMVAAQEPFGYFKAEPFGWRDCAETDEGAIALYEAPQPQEDALDAVNIDRLGKALTKLGHSTWVSQEEAAADIPRWINALTSCVLEIPEAAPQPQADARDAERYRFLRSRDLETVNSGGVFAGVTPDNIVLNGADLDAEIDAAIAAAKEMK